LSDLIPYALIYDFDGTLAPGNMQEHHFLPQIGMTPDAFWTEVRRIAQEQEADQILVYMNLMRRKAELADKPFRKEDFLEHGRDLPLFPGVEDWFDRISAHGEAQGVAIEHYLITSGNAEIVEGTSIFDRFKRVFGSRYLYDANGVASWPAQAINYTTKTQYIFRINKGALDLRDDGLINDFVALDQRPVPFRHMAFIGDGATDVPCFRLVRDHGGLSLAVFDPDTAGSDEKSRKLLAQGRVDCFAAADYRAGTTLETMVKHHIDMVASRTKLLRASEA
jgi:phosphoserine phosphatase